MSTAQQHARRVSELIVQRRRFVEATVVRAQCPTSARPGDAAIVLPDGSIEGFVGGQCAEESVRVTALDVLEHGEATLLRILPDGSEGFPEAPGAITVVNPCLSGGAIEVFLEAKVPAARIVVVGATPIADALVQLGTPLGFAMDPPADGSAVDGATAVVIASHGRAEEETIRAALDAGVDFIGLVASQKRGAAVLASLDLNADEAVGGAEPGRRRHRCADRGGDRVCRSSPRSCGRCVSMASGRRRATPNRHGRPRRSTRSAA